jgi:hypothetical protein
MLLRLVTLFFSLSSKKDAADALDWGEGALLIFSFAILIGIGLEEFVEIRPLRMWPNIPIKRSWYRNWPKLFVVIVIVGVGGEFFADAVIWEASDSYEAISDSELKAAYNRAEEAHFNADVLGKLTIPRQLTQDEYDKIFSVLSRFPRFSIKMEVLPNDWESRDFAVEIEKVLFDVGETIIPSQPPTGLWMRGITISNSGWNAMVLLDAFAVANAGAWNNLDVWKKGEPDAELILRIGPAEPPRIATLASPPIQRKGPRSMQEPPELNR